MPHPTPHTSVVSSDMSIIAQSLGLGGAPAQNLGLFFREEAPLNPDGYVQGYVDVLCQWALHPVAYPHTLRGAPFEALVRRQTPRDVEALGPLVLDPGIFLDLHSPSYLAVLLERSWDGGRDGGGHPLVGPQLLYLPLPRDQYEHPEETRMFERQLQIGMHASAITLFNSLRLAEKRRAHVTVVDAMALAGFSMRAFPLHLGAAVGRDVKGEPALWWGGGMGGLGGGGLGGGVGGGAGGDGSSSSVGGGTLDMDPWTSAREEADVLAYSDRLMEDWKRRNVKPDPIPLSVPATPVADPCRAAGYVHADDDDDEDEAFYASTEAWNAVVNENLGKDVRLEQQRISLAAQKAMGLLDDDDDDDDEGVDGSRGLGGSRGSGSGVSGLGTGSGTGSGSGSGTGSGSRLSPVLERWVPKMGGGEVHPRRPPSAQPYAKPSSTDTPYAKTSLTKTTHTKTKTTHTKHTEPLLEGHEQDPDVERQRAALRFAAPSPHAKRVRTAHIPCLGLGADSPEKPSPMDAKKRRLQAFVRSYPVTSYPSAPWRGILERTLPPPQELVLSLGMHKPRVGLIRIPEARERLCWVQRTAWGRDSPHAALWALVAKATWPDAGAFVAVAGPRLMREDEDGEGDGSSEDGCGDGVDGALEGDGDGGEDSRGDAARTSRGPTRGGLYLCVPLARSGLTWIERFLRISNFTAFPKAVFYQSRVPFGGAFKTQKQYDAHLSWVFLPRLAGFTVDLPCMGWYSSMKYPQYDGLLPLDWCPRAVPPGAPDATSLTQFFFGKPFDDEVMDVTFRGLLGEDVQQSRFSGTLRFARALMETCRVELAGAGIPLDPRAVEVYEAIVRSSLHMDTIGGLRANAGGLRGGPLTRSKTRG